MPRRFCASRGGWGPRATRLGPARGSGVAQVPGPRQRCFAARSPRFDRRVLGRPVRRPPAPRPRRRSVRLLPLCPPPRSRPRRAAAPRAPARRTRPSAR